MATQCKVCNSTFRETVDERLFKNESGKEISEWLDGKGETISAPSIIRHRDKHLTPATGDRPNVVKGQTTPVQSITTAEAQAGTTVLIDLTKVIDSIEAEATVRDVIGGVAEARKRTQLCLERIVQKQLAIVSDQQDQYCAGTAGYPDAQIRGLKTVLDAVNALPAYNNDRVVNDMRDTQRWDVLRLVKQLAMTTCEQLDYKPWDIYHGRLVIEPPYDTIVSLVGKITSPDGHMYHETLKAHIIEWEEIINDNLPRECALEREVMAVLDGMADEFAEWGDEVVNAFKKGYIDVHAKPSDLYYSASGDMATHLEACFKLEAPTYKGELLEQQSTGGE